MAQDNASRDGERVPGPATPLLVAAELSNGPGFSALHGAVWTFALHRCVQQDFWPCLLGGLGLNEYNSTPYETSKGPLLTSLLAEALHATGHASYMIAMLAGHGFRACQDHEMAKKKHVDVLTQALTRCISGNLPQTSLRWDMANGCAAGALHSHLLGGGRDTLAPWCVAHVGGSSGLPSSFARICYSMAFDRTRMRSNCSVLLSSAGSLSNAGELGEEFHEACVYGWARHAVLKLFSYKPPTGNAVYSLPSAPLPVFAPCSGYAGGHASRALFVSCINAAVDVLNGFSRINRSVACSPMVLRGATTSPSLSMKASLSLEKIAAGACRSRPTCTVQVGSSTLICA